MNKKQKNVLLTFTLLLLSIATIASIVLFFIGHTTKDEQLQLVAFITSIISPATLIGVIIKVIINRFHIKNVNTTLANAGLKDVEITSRDKKDNLAIYKINQKTFIEKEHILLIKFPETKIDDIHKLNELKHTMNYYVQQKREELLNPKDN